MMRSVRSLLLPACLVLASALVRAQEPAASAPAPAEAASASQQVDIVGVRDPAMMPYKAAYEMLSRVDGVAQGRARLVIKVLSDRTREPIPGLRVRLQGESFFADVEVSDAGIATIPLSRQAYDDHAEFTTNQRKGTLRVETLLLPNLPSDGLTGAELARSVAAGRDVLRELLPWYLRLILPSIHAIGLCYPSRGQAVGLPGTPPASVPASAEATDPVTKAPLFCADLEPQRLQATAAGDIDAPPGWTALYR